MKRTTVVMLTWIIVAHSCAAVHAQLTESQVLVIYNSQSADTNLSGQADGKDIFDYYKQQYPNVLGFDLNDPTLLSGEISYADFANKVRDPVRDFLTTNSLQQDVHVFTLTKGLPHRIYDINTPTLGDTANAAGAQLGNGNISYASVDSELTLLYQDLSNGEAGGTLDSHADNVALNPYHNTTQSITSFSRANIDTPLTFDPLGSAAYQLEANGNPVTAGRIYLTSRLDGNSVDDVRGMIDRAQVANYQQFDDRILFDEPLNGDLDGRGLFSGNDAGNLGEDYNEAAAQLGTKYNNVTIESTDTFQIGSNSANYQGTVLGEVINDSIAVLASYGGNHGGDVTGYVESFAGQFTDGAILNTFESFNAKVFGNVTNGFRDQAQLVSFVESGGTFGVGQTWEPFAFSLSDNEVLVENFLFGGLTWVEAAWTSIPWLSWQNLVLGDPLAKATLIIDPRDAVWNGNAEVGAPGDGTNWAAGANWSRGGFADFGFRTGDRVIFAAGSTTFAIDVDRDRIVESLQFQSDYQLQGPGRLVMRSGNVTVDENIIATISTEIMASRGVHKMGLGALVFESHADQLEVHEGILGGGGSANILRVRGGSTFSPGNLETAGQFTVSDDFQLDVGGTLRIELDGMTNSADHLDVGGTAILAGTVDIVPVNQYQPPQVRGDFDSFQLITADSIEGDTTFAFEGVELLAAIGLDDDDENLVAHGGDGLFQLLRYEADGLELISYLALPGDANGDFSVDAADFAIWEENKFTSGTDWLTGDFNGDGLTDVRDFNIWNDNDGMLAGAAVPEPSAFWLLMFGPLIGSRATRFALRRE